jgi:hypothetical protein
MVKLRIVPQKMKICNQTTGLYCQARTCMWYHSPIKATRENPSAMAYCRWYVTFIGLPSAPIGVLAVASFAVIANCSFSNSAKATDLTDTRRTSLKPSKRSKIVVRSSSSTSRGIFWRKSVLFGRTYSSGTTAAPVFAARGFSAVTAGLACAFASSSARLKSAHGQYVLCMVVAGEAYP